MFTKFDHSCHFTRGRGTWLWGKGPKKELDQGRGRAEGYCPRGEGAKGAGKTWLRKGRGCKGGALADGGGLCSNGEREGTWPRGGPCSTFSEEVGQG